MKKLILLFLFLPLFAAGQNVPNGNFENWVFQGWFYNPVDWETGNTQFFTPVIQDSDAYEGDYAMQVNAIPIGIGMYAEATTDFDISMMPQVLNFYTKYFCAFGGVSVEIFFYNDSTLISSSDWYGTDTLDTYTFVSIPIEPTDSVITRARIKVSAQVGDFSPGSARILVDQMAFGLHTSVPEEMNPSFSVYPNPAGETIRIISKSPPGRLIIFDALGRKVLTQNVINTDARIDISKLKPGVYMLVCKSGTQKVVVR